MPTFYFMSSQILQNEVMCFWRILLASCECVVLRVMFSDAQVLYRDCDKMGFCTGM